MIAIGLGSNLGDSQQHIESAIQALQAHQHINIIQVSGIYLSKPVDGSIQNDFHNAVIALQTSLQPSELLEFCQLIEKHHQRIKHWHWGPRTLDLDILCFNELCLQTQSLTLPHPEIANRDFVLTPLLELDNDLSIPQLGKLNLLPTPPQNIFKKLPKPVLSTKVVEQR